MVSQTERGQSSADGYSKHRRILIVLGVAGLVAFATALVQSPQRAWANVLLGNTYFLFLALFGVVFVALTYIFSSGWAVVFRRVPEAMSAYLPIGGVLMLVLFLFGGPRLYAWTQPGALVSHPVLKHKLPYLNSTLFLLRMVVAFALWIFFSQLLRRHSQQQDIDGDLAHTRKNQTYSAVFLLLFTVTFIFASFDWLMSLEPEWYSTMFPVYVFAGLFLGGAAAMIVLVIQFQQKGLLSGVTDHHLYELARVLCAASTAWAYVWFCQYMLIYYTNIPEETVYYARRLAGAWSPLFPLNLILSWVIPLAVLIPARCRRSSRCLLLVCSVVLVGRWLDLYLLIMAGLSRPLCFGLVEVFTFLGFLPLFVLPLAHTFRKAEPTPRRDPYLVESVHLRV